MRMSSLYFVYCALISVWLVVADYRGWVIWGAGGATRRYASGYQHK